MVAPSPLHADRGQGLGVVKGFGKHAKGESLVKFQHVAEEAGFRVFLSLDSPPVSGRARSPRCGAGLRDTHKACECTEAAPPGARARCCSLTLLLARAQAGSPPEPRTSLRIEHEVLGRRFYQWVVLVLQRMPSFTVCYWHRLLTDAQLHSPPTFAV